MRTRLRHEAPVNRTRADTLRSRLRIRHYRKTLQRRLASVSDGQRRLIDLALNEAEALVWQTPFPQFLFPALAEEKAQAVTRWQNRQQAIRHREIEHVMAV